MNTRILLATLLFPLLAAAQATAADATPPAPPASRELKIVVIESLGHNPNAPTLFDRIDRVFTEEFERRKWPVTISVERFGANTPKYETELRVFFQGIREETHGDLTFRAWITLQDRDTKHDFGIVRYQYYLRPGRQIDDILDDVIRGGAAAAADKIEPVLFPKAAEAQPRK